MPAPDQSSHNSSSPTMLHHFPSELWDAILDLVWSADLAADPALEKGQRRDASCPAPAIHACAAVCKAWLPRARHCSFSRLRIGDGLRSPLLFGDVVSHPLCTFRSSVLYLVLRGEDLDEECSDLSHVWPYTYLLQTLFSLEFERVNLRTASTPVDRPIFSAQAIPSGITTLDIYSTSYDTFLQLAECISHCQRLQCLFLSSLECDDWDVSEVLARQLPVPRTLQEFHLHWHEPALQPLLNWLCPHPGALELRTLLLRCVGYNSNVLYASTFVQNAGRSIETLLVEIPAGDYPPRDEGIAKFCEQGGLSTLTSLRVLTICGQLSGETWISGIDGTPRDIPLWTSRYINSLPPACPVSECRFKIQFHLLEHWNVFAWQEALEAIGRRFPLLNRVVWTLTLGDSPSDCDVDGIRGRARELVAMAIKKSVDVLFTVELAYIERI
ncbi:hypothetical protein EXIGLDRAFT_833019 [Exidia glandulosa HHB12029]|uniref:F-box domain-containing protein n=1 Tax=Exidia glandulosa HHB12029 TaxID=1314781 RepID=A0A165L468_EXIGL|nr:hypothetical protein EXIGLDRAFT_756183 [Exidia glandulosa HHB12029]KZV97323.1 hypothetical protein EXIGLDRAFT_833019 [Exidia glandulosa HHB12029]